MIKITNNDHISEVSLYGKCEQNGTPAPDNPIDIVCNNGALRWDSINRRIYIEGTQETITDNLGNNATAEMLLSVGDYKDIQKVIEGGVTRNVGVKVLNGGESWSPHATIPGWFQLPDSSVYPFISVALCTHYQYNETQGYTGIYFSTGRNSESGSSRIVIVDSERFPNVGMVTEFKQYLADQYAAGTPVIIVYPLATPTSESVTPQALPGNTVTQIAGSISDMDFDVSHMFDLKERYVGSTEVKKVYNGSNLVHLHLKDNTKFMRRITCNNGIGEGVDVTGKIESIKGTTLVWNQRIRNANFAGGTTSWYGPYTNARISGSTLTVDINATSGTHIGIAQSIDTPIAGHKYLLDGYISTTTPSVGRLEIIVSNNASGLFTMQTATTTEFYRLRGILTSKGTGTVMTFGQINAREGTTLSIKSPRMFDLTQMFGAGNEPTIEEFEKLFPLDYYDYNEGSLLSFNGTGLKTTGFNQWDEEWETGGIHVTTGEPINDRSKIRSKNFSPCFGGVTYYKKATNVAILFFYDANKDYIGFEETAINRTVVTPSNAAYFKIRVGNELYPISTYNNDICINLSDPKRNGTYKAYEEHDTEFKVNTLTGKLNGEGESVVIFPDGMKSAGSVYDEIVGNKAIKRIGSVDLGTLTWQYNSQSAWRCFSTTIADKKYGGSNLVCVPYVVSAVFNTTTEKIISDNNSNTTVYVRDSSYSTVAAFKTAMSGVMLYYELATPEEYILDDFQLPLSYPANGEGAEEITTDGTSSPDTTPADMDIDYKLR